MRENFRYILARISPMNEFESRDIYRAVAESVITLYGDDIAAHMWPAVMQVKGPYVIIRCRRGTEKKLETALSSITSVQGTRSALHPVRTSGTIKTLREIIPKVMRNREGRAVIAGNTYEVIIAGRGRIDLKDKGIYLDIPRYITKEDTEDLNYDE